MQTNRYLWLKKHQNLIIGVGIFVFILTASFKAYVWEIPKTWDMQALDQSHLPPPDPSYKIGFAPESYYNSLPEHVIYKTYPVYAQGYEPPGYLDSLKALEPEIAFDLSKIRTQEDWIKAGEEVFFWPAGIAGPNSAFGSHLDSAYLADSGDPITKDGVYPFAKYVITEQGKVQYGDLSCATCHTRVTDEGELIVGAQGNHAFDAGFAHIVDKFEIPMQVLNPGTYALLYTPWDPTYGDSIMSRNSTEFIADLKARPKGTMSRQGGRFNLPLVVPSLIGIEDIKYLDNTGLMRHESPGDLMRYAALNQGMDMLIAYNDYIPMDENRTSQLPELKDWQHAFGYDAKRYTDAQLYALTQYIYSLVPPVNPHEFPEALLTRGQQVFNEQGCVTCHTPPLYTNNMLTPAEGFEPPPEHFETYDIFNVSVETDTRSTLKSRRGTGYYKIPSLRGLWYRGPFFHNGQLATLEDVFDPKRLQDDYVPTGFKDPDVDQWAVKGHDFGMDLSEEDKEALIAFLKTL